MAKRTNRRQKSPKIKRKIALLIFLIVVLLGLSAAAYSSYQYDSAKRESLKLIEESTGNNGNNGNQEIEEIEFNSEEETDEFIHVLLVGIDTDGGGPARTDTMMIAQYQPKKGKAKLVSLMRDSYVEIPGYRNNKINTSFFLGGPELLRQTIKENFDIDINYYALVDFNGFVRVVDIISPDGMEVDIEKRMFYQDNVGGVNINFEPGLQKLDGQQALNYVRFRSDSENDFGRVRRQQEVLSILKDELLSFSGVTRLPKLLGSIDPYIQTNFKSKQILDYGRDFFLNPIDRVETLTIPIKNSYVDAHYGHAGAVLELDMEKNKQALYEFLELDELQQIEE